jgi:hypothetical protein
MYYRRRVDTSAYLILWQVGVAGDQSFARFSTDCSTVKCWSTCWPATTNVIDFLERLGQD